MRAKRLRPRRLSACRALILQLAQDEGSAICGQILMVSLSNHGPHFFSILLLKVLRIKRGMTLRQASNLVDFKGLELRGCDG